MKDSRERGLCMILVYALKCDMQWALEKTNYVLTWIYQEIFFLDN